MGMSSLSVRAGRRSAIVVLTAIAGLAVHASATTVVYVDQNAAPGGNGTSWSSAKRDLSSALTALSTAGGGEIRVAAGTYKPGNGSSSRSSTFSIPAQVVVRGGYAGSSDPANPDRLDPAEFLTLLDGNLGDENLATDNAYTVVTVNVPGSWATVENLTILNGYASGSGSLAFGAGARVQAGEATFRNVSFRHNFAEDHGGAVYTNGTSVTRFIDTDFVANTARDHGGATYHMGGTAAYERVRFLGNGAYLDGGAIYASSTNLTVNDAHFNANTAGVDGGAILLNQTSASIAHCRFIDNSSFGSGGFSGGGAIRVSSSNAKIVHSVFDANQSTAMGGAIYLFGGSLDVGNGRFYNNRSVHGGAVAQSVGATNLINCTISHNRALRGGGGAHVGGGVMNVLLSTVVCNRVSGPEGGGLNIYGGTLNVENSLLWDNVSGLPQLDRANVFRFNGTLNTTYTLIPDETLARTYTLADLVVDAAGPDGIPGTEDDDLRLKHGSLALNWGNAAMLPMDYMDLDGDGITDEPLPIDAMGNARVQGASVDAGAFEGAHVLTIPDSPCESSTPTPNTCPSDVNGDGFTTIEDYFNFLTYFFASINTPCE